MISQQLISLFKSFYATAWVLAVSLTTFGAFVCMAICLSQHELNDNTSCEDIVEQ